jgi:predicted nucleic acid-binding protein
VSTVFADTFYWIAFTLPLEAAYAQAQSVTDNIVTTEEVLGEYLTFFSRAPEHLRRRAGMTVKTILTDSKVRVIPQSHESFMLGLDLYLARADKGYSLIDCISMQTMERESLKDVLTNDKHFEQEGFRALFRA